MYQFIAKKDLLLQIQSHYSSHAAQKEYFTFQNIFQINFV
jgi:hypothetical protein